MIREKDLPLQTTSVKPITFLRLLIPSGEAVSAPPLSAILGQVQINSSEFCKIFNAFTAQRFENGVLLNVDLYKNADNSYYFIIRGISFPYLLFQVSDHNRSIPVEILYDSFKIKLSSIGINLDFNTAKLLFGSIRSINFSVIL
jgi:hypothetical protein